MKTRYTTDTGEHIIIDHETYSYRWETKGSAPEVGAFVRLKFLAKPHGGAGRLSLEVQPVSDYVSSRIIISSAIVHIEDWWDHNHRYDILGIYRQDNWDIEGWFCICGQRQGEAVNSKSMNILIAAPYKYGGIPDVPKQVEVDDNNQTLIPPFQIKKVTNIKLDGKELTRVVKPAPLQLPPVTPERRVPVIPNDAPIATSIHDKV